MLWDLWYGAIIAAAGAALMAVLTMAYRRFGVRPEARRLLLLVIVVCMVGLYRAVFPVQYSTRKVWHNTRFNATITVRTLAMVAELATIIAVYDAFGGGWMMRLAVALVAIAQIPATLGAAMPYEWLFAAEETLWALAGVTILAVGVLVLRGRWASVPLPRNARALAIASVIAMTLYLAFQVWVLTVSWKNADKPPASTLSWCDTSRVARSGYGAVHAVWSVGYFAVLPWVLAALVYSV